MDEQQVRVALMMIERKPEIMQIIKSSPSPDLPEMLGKLLGDIFREGYAQGHNAGYNEGHTHGYEEGYGVCWNDENGY